MQLYIFFYLNFKITGHLLQINISDIYKDTCEVIIKWSHPTVDAHLITEYIVWRYSLHNNNWFFDEMVSVGIDTQYTTKCTLQPGRLYEFHIRQNVSLTDPDETFLLFPRWHYIITGMFCFSFSHRFFISKSY